MQPIGPAGGLFLMLFGVLLPFMVIRAGCRAAASGKTLPRSKHFLGVLVNR